MEKVDEERLASDHPTKEDDILNKRMKYIHETLRGQSGLLKDDQLEHWRRHMVYKPLDVIKIL